MSEKPPRMPGAKEPLSPKEQEHADTAAFFLEIYAAKEKAPEGKEQHAELIQELETRLSDFESAHDLEALHSAVIRTYEEAKAHVEREAAKADMPRIVILINSLEKEGLLGASNHLYSRYCAIQRAIGSLNNGELRHDIPIG